MDSKSFTIAFTFKGIKCLFSLQSSNSHASLKTDFLKIQKEDLKRLYLMLSFQGKSLCFLVALRRLLNITDRYQMGHVVLALVKILPL